MLRKELIEKEAVVLPQKLIDEINSIVPGRQVTSISKPGLLARGFGRLASILARFLIWLDASIYSMLCWWGGEKVTALQALFHVSVAATFIYTMAQPELTWWQAPLLVLGSAVLISVPIQFVLYSFEFSLMGKNEKVIGKWETFIERKLDGRDSDGRHYTYEAGKYSVGLYHARPTMLECAFYWPICLFFVLTECLAHYLLVLRDHALGNKYGSFVLLPEDWVEFYKEVPRKDYTGFVPEHFTRRLDQVLKDHDGEVFVLVPFGLMPGHLPDLNQSITEKGRMNWHAHLENIQRPQGDPVLAVRLDDDTKYGRMLVVGHWLTVATLQKFNLLFQKFDIESEKIA